MIDTVYQVFAYHGGKTKRVFQRQESFELLHMISSLIMSKGSIWLHAFYILSPTHKTFMALIISKEEVI